MFKRIIVTTFCIAGVGTGAYYLAVFLQELERYREEEVKRLLAKIPYSKETNIKLLFPDVRSYWRFFGCDPKINEPSCTHERSNFGTGAIKTIFKKHGFLVGDPENAFKEGLTYKGLKCKKCYPAAPYGVNTDIVSHITKKNIKINANGHIFTNLISRWREFESKIKPGDYVVLCVTPEYPNLTWEVSKFTSLKVIVIIDDDVPLKNLLPISNQLAGCFVAQSFGSKETLIELARCLCLSSQSKGKQFLLCNAWLGIDKEALLLERAKTTDKPIVTIVTHVIYPFYCNSLLIKSGYDIEEFVLQELFLMSHHYCFSIVSLISNKLYLLLIHEPWVPFAIHNPIANPKRPRLRLTIGMTSGATLEYLESEFSHKGILDTLTKLLQVSEADADIVQKAIPVITLKESDSGVRPLDNPILCVKLHQENENIVAPGVYGRLKQADLKLWHKVHLKEDGLRCIRCFNGFHQGCSPSIIQAMKESKLPVSPAIKELREAIRLLSLKYKGKHIIVSTFDGAYKPNVELPFWAQACVLLTSNVNESEQTIKGFNKWRDTLIISPAFKGRVMGVMRVVISLFFSENDVTSQICNCDFFSILKPVTAKIKNHAISTFPETVGLAAGGDCFFGKNILFSEKQIQAIVTYGNYYGADEIALGLLPHVFEVDPHVKQQLSAFAGNVVDNRSIPNRWIPTNVYSKPLVFMPSVSNGAFALQALRLKSGIPMDPFTKGVTKVCLIGVSTAGKTSFITSLMNSNRHLVLNQQMTSVDNDAIFTLVTSSHVIQILELGGLDLTQPINSLHNTTFISLWKRHELKGFQFIFVVNSSHLKYPNIEDYYEATIRETPDIDKYDIWTWDAATQMDKIEQKLFAGVPFQFHDFNVPPHGLIDWFNATFSSNEGLVLTKLTKASEIEKMLGLNNKANSTSSSDTNRDLLEEINKIHISLSDITSRLLTSTEVRTEIDKEIKERKLVNQENLEEVVEKFSDLTKGLSDRLKALQDIQNGLAEFMTKVDDGYPNLSALIIKIREEISDALEKGIDKALDYEIKVDQSVELFEKKFSEFVELIQVSVPDEQSQQEWSNNVARVDDILLRLQASVLATEIGNTLEFRHAVAEAIRRRRISLRSVDDQEEIDVEADSVICNAINDVIDARLDPQSPLYKEREKIQKFSEYLSDLIIPSLVRVVDYEIEGRGIITTVGVPLDTRTKEPYDVIGLEAENILSVTPRLDLDVPITSVGVSKYEVLNIIQGTPVSKLDPRIIPSLQALTGLRNNTLKTLEVRFTDNLIYTPLVTLTTWTNDGWQSVFQEDAYYEVNHRKTHLKVSRTPFKDAKVMNIKNLLNDPTLNNIMLD